MPADEPRPEPSAPPAASPADDLTRIQGIDRSIARRLAEAGITRYAQIAAWRRSDVDHVTTALKLGRAVFRQGWIEQAARLDSELGKQRPGQRHSAGPPAGFEAGAAGALATSPPASPVCYLVELGAEGPPPLDPLDRSPAADGLAAIRGMSAEHRRELEQAGVTHAAEIAAWRAVDVAQWSGRAGFGKRVTRHGWIEQAALLARGIATDHARRAQAGLLPALVARPAELPSRSGALLARLAEAAALLTSEREMEQLHRDAASAARAVLSLPVFLGRPKPPVPVAPVATSPGESGLAALPRTPLSGPMESTAALAARLARTSLTASGLAAAATTSASVSAAGASTPPNSIPPASLPSSTQTSGDRVARLNAVLSEFTAPRPGQATDFESAGIALDVGEATVKIIKPGDQLGSAAQPSTPETLGHRLHSRPRPAETARGAAKPRCGIEEAVVEIVSSGRPFPDKEQPSSAPAVEGAQRKPRSQRTSLLDLIQALRRG